MARNQKNFQNFLYVDDNGDSWTKRGEDGGGAAAVDGHATFSAANRTWEDSSRMKVRRILYQDPVTFRTADPIFYTAAAFAAVALGDIIAVDVQGDATTINYAAVKKLPERQPRRAA